ARRKRLHCRYFYDAEGSRLFEEICALPEYYLTRTERRILRERAAEIARGFPGPVALVELGSGSAVKTRLLIEALLAEHGALRYVPVDISRSILEESARALLADYPRLEIRALAAEYQEGLRQLHREHDRPKLILWLGSNIGNLDRPEAAAFLAGGRRALDGGDRPLLGIDLRKQPSPLEAAYDDPAGGTARFHPNLLARLHPPLGGDFDLDGFRHRAVYQEEEGRIEMYLDSRRAQQVRIGRLERAFDFAEGEPIHTENSYKYSLAEIDALARATGLHLAAQWLDPDRGFSVNLFAAE